jgi:hypothetical protein
MALRLLPARPYSTTGGLRMRADAEDGGGHERGSKSAD